MLEERDKLPHCPPLLVKIAPDLTTKDKEDIAAVITRDKVFEIVAIIDHTNLNRKIVALITYKHYNHTGSYCVHCPRVELMV